MDKVFVCYASEDTEMVRKIVVGLREEMNMDVWFGPDKLSSVESQFEQVRDAIKQSSVFMFCASLATDKRNPKSFLAIETQEALQMLKGDQPFRAISIRLHERARVPEELSGPAVANFALNDWHVQLLKLGSSIRGK